jgi:hypothetical protein
MRLSFHLDSRWLGKSAIGKKNLFITKGYINVGRRRARLAPIGSCQDLRSKIFFHAQQIGCFLLGGWQKALSPNAFQSRDASACRETIPLPVACVNELATTRVAGPGGAVYSHFIGRSPGQIGKEKRQGLLVEQWYIFAKFRS